VRLEVAASEVGLEEREVSGMAYTLYGGRATWDLAGKAGYAAAVLEDVVPEDGVSEGSVSQEQEAVPAPPAPDSRGEQAESAPAESVPAESVPATTVGGIAGALLEAYDNLEAERRLLGFGIIGLTLIIVALMAWRLPIRGNVEEDSAAWGSPQEYYENYAPPEASPETARGPEGEPSSSPPSGAPPEEATREPSVSSSSTSHTASNNSSSGSSAEGAEDAVVTEDAVAEGGGTAAASAGGQERLGQERLRRVRHLRRIRQRRTPSSWWGDEP
jgi:hypothetical protein